MDTLSVVNNISKQLNISKELLLEKSVKYFLENELKDIKINIFQIGKKYNINNIYEFDDLYKNGKIEEIDSFDDYKELDRLEFKKEKLEALLRDFE
jgi:hypothetical protein